MAIISVIMTATAASLITFAKQSSVNEHRLQATSYLTQLHEQLQAAPWNRVALYQHEYEDLAPLEDDAEFAARLDLDAAPPTFDGDPISLIPGPFDYGDCDAECSRLPFVPRPYQEGPVSEDADQRFHFEVFQIVTERREASDPDDPDDVPNVKRFTTIVRWELAGRPFQQVFDSERAATSADLREPEEQDVRLALFSPRFIEVKEDDEGAWSNELAHDVVVRFAYTMDGGVELRYPQAGGGFGTLSLEPDEELNEPGDETAWHGSIAPGGLVDLLPPSGGEREIELEVVGHSSTLDDPIVQPIEAFIVEDPEWSGFEERADDVVRLVDEDGDPLIPPITIEVAVDPRTGEEDVICDPVLIEAEFEHRDEDFDEGVAMATAYFAGEGSQSRSMSLGEDGVHNNNKWFIFEAGFAVGESSPWLPSRNEPHEHVYRDERIFVIAHYEDAGGFSHESLIFESDVFEVVRRGFGYPCGGSGS